VKDPQTGKTQPRALSEMEPRKDTSNGDPVLKGRDSRNIVLELHRPGKPTEGEPAKTSDDPRYVSPIAHE